MITLDILCARFTTLRREDLQRWIGDGLVRPHFASPHLEILGLSGDDILFEEIDVERVRLILDLRDAMAVNEEALPVVLSLLDQLYDLRRRLRAMGVEPDGVNPTP